MPDVFLLGLAALMLLVVAALTFWMLRRLRAQIENEIARNAGVEPGAMADMSFVERLQYMAEQMQRSSVDIDPARFGDPMAERVDWTPARPGGTNFTTHRLVEPHPSRLEFRASWQSLALSLAFVAGGAGMAALFALQADWRNGPALLSVLPAIVLGLVFAGIGVIMYLFVAGPRVFDRATGRFWIGRRPPQHTATGGDDKSCWLGDVHALQVLPERVSGKNGSYWSYELNLVLQDGRRIPVVDHGGLERMRADAGRLASVLDCKLWDASEFLAESAAEAAEGPAQGG